jgi:hypothetical protein
MLAAGLAGLAVAEVVTAVVLSIVIGWSWRDALETYVVTNSLMGVVFAGCSGILAWHRPRNPIGWLFVAAGLAHSTTALATPLGALLHATAAPIALQRIVITIFAWSWPWSIGLVLPLALLLFPDGRPPARRWRWVVIAVIVTAPLFSLESGAFPHPIEPGYPVGYLTFSGYDALQPLWTATEIRGLLALGAGLAALAVRYRRGSDIERRQLLWLLLAVLVALIVILPWGLVAGTPVEVLLAIPLIPIAVTVAIVRHQLLDIRLVVSRLLAWLMLLLVVVVAYAGLVALLGRFTAPRLGWSALVTVLLVLLAAPLLPRLQRLVDGALYGDRGDPARVIARLGEQLATPGLQGVVTTIRSALRLPYLAIERDDKGLASDGEPPERVHPWRLTRGGTSEGRLMVGCIRAIRIWLKRIVGRLPYSAIQSPLRCTTVVRRNCKRLGADRRSTGGGAQAVAPGATTDGPGADQHRLAADAAANTVTSDPDQSQALLATLRRDTRAALADVRRLVDNLRPPALDELGLVGALQQRADQLSWRADGASVQVRLDVPDQVPALPAAVEVATYRIATEALTNVVRHSKATGAFVRLRCDQRLELSITMTARLTARGRRASD